MGIHRISLGSVEHRNPVRSELTGFRFLVLFILALQPHTAQSLGLLLLAIDLAVQSAIRGSGNNTNDFLGGLAIGIHFLYLLKLLGLIIGFGTT